MMSDHLPEENESYKEKCQRCGEKEVTWKTCGSCGFQGDCSDEFTKLENDDGKDENGVLCLQEN